jgi:UDP-GlcNAc:undecaprenyl-phosphate/decaprenyl-phosphate GlcNAc-1-phosphate transferase
MAPRETVAGMYYLVAAVGAAGVAALASFILTPMVQKAALRHGVAHEPRARDLHTRPVARWGGLAIYGAFVLAVLVALVVVQWTFACEIPWRTLKVGVGVLLTGTVLSILGAFDDLYDIPPGKQMIAQILCAAVVIPFGVRIDVLSDPLHPGAMLFLGAWSYPLTLLWLVAVTNAINWIDGLDGLAAGVCAIAAMTLGLMAAQSTQPALALIAGALCGSLLGFLRHNFNPAKIYMGGGALFVGFCLAAIAAVGAFKAATAMALLVPILILGVPIYDTAFVITRRILQGKPIYQADKNHLHHRLLARGFSHRQTVLILYSVSFSLSVVATLLYFKRM